MVLNFHQCLQKKHNLCIDSGEVAMQSFIVLCLLVSEKNVPKINIMGIWLTISPYWPYVDNFKKVSKHENVKRNKTH